MQKEFQEIVRLAIKVFGKESGDEDPFGNYNGTVSIEFFCTIPCVYVKVHEAHSCDAYVAQYMAETDYDESFPYSSATVEDGVKALTEKLQSMLD